MINGKMDEFEIRNGVVEIMIPNLIRGRECDGIYSLCYGECLPIKGIDEK